MKIFQLVFLCLMTLPGAAIGDQDGAEAETLEALKVVDRQIQTMLARQHKERNLVLFDSTLKSSTKQRRYRELLERQRKERLKPELRRKALQDRLDAIRNPGKAPRPPEKELSEKPTSKIPEDRTRKSMKEVRTGTPFELTLVVSTTMKKQGAITRSAWSQTTENLEGSFGPLTIRYPLIAKPLYGKRYITRQIPDLLKAIEDRMKELDRQIPAKGHDTRGRAALTSEYESLKSRRLRLMAMREVLEKTFALRGVRRSHQITFEGASIKYGSRTVAKRGWGSSAMDVQISASKYKRTGETTSWASRPPYTLVCFAGPLFTQEAVKILKADPENDGNLEKRFRSILGQYLSKEAQELLTAAPDTRAWTLSQFDLLTLWSMPIHWKGTRIDTRFEAKKKPTKTTKKIDLNGFSHPFGHRKVLGVPSLCVYPSYSMIGTHAKFAYPKARIDTKLHSPDGWQWDHTPGGFATMSPLKGKTGAYVLSRLESNGSLELKIQWELRRIPE